MSCRLLISFLLLVGSIFAAFGASPIPPVIRSTRFNGNLSQAVSYASHPALNLTNAPMTVEAWVFREDATRCETIASRGFTDSWWLGFCGKLRFYRGGSSADADVEVPANQWTHVAASYDGARVRFYVDGILRGDKPLARGTVGAARGVVIGGDPSPGPIFSAGYPFKGYLDEVRIWSVARTAAELGAGRFREVRGVPGLVVAFSEGGEGATLPDLEPLSTVDVSRLSGFGIVPRDLKVPVGSFPVTLDGEVFLNTEYSGAEQMVMRYSNGPDVRDVPIYLINSGTTNSPKLNIAALGLRFPAVPFDQSGITIFMHSNTVAGPTRGTGDSAFTIPFAGSPKGVRYVSGGPDVAFTTDFFWKEARSLCLGEFDPPCVETLISTLGLGLGTAQRIMIQQYGDPAITGRVNAPSDTSVNQPSSWPELTYIEVPNTNARSIVLFVQAQNPFSWNPDEREYSQILSRRVSFYSGDSSLGGLPVFSAQMWRGDWVNAVTLADRNLTVKLHLEPGDTLLDIRFQSRGGRLIRTNAPGEYVFGLCTNAPSNRCEMGLLYFNMLPDLGPLVVTNISTNQLALPVTVRDRPRKIAGGGTFRVDGTNVHNQIEAYLSICSSNRILTCLPESNSIPLEILGVGGLRDWVNLRIPELPRSFWGRTMTVWIRDRLPSREHFGTEWNRVPGPAGEVTLVPPPWPDLYGFEFENRGNFTGPEEFEATYGESVFTFIPLPPFKVRDPYYYTIWWWMYLALADIADGGSCHGFAAASQLYFRGLIPISKYDLSTNGIRYPTGFPSSIVDGHRVPFGAPRWSGFDLFKPFEPVNLWAQIRVYMMAQFSDEALGNTVSQVRLHSFLGSDPNEQLARMAAAGGVRGFILCFNPGGIGTGHCVTPYEVVPDMGLDPESNHMVPRAGHSVIKVYDNNWPETERYMMVEPRSRGGYYTYRLGPETVWSSRSLTRTPLSIFTGARHAPGGGFIADPDLLYRLITARGVRPEYSDSEGRKVGWDAGGNFHESYAGAAAVIPWSLFNTNRDNSILTTFLPSTNAPASISLRTTAPRFAVHLGQEMTVFQLIASNAVPGSLDRASLLTQGGLLNGLNYRPQLAHRGLTPMLCQTLPGTNRMIFRLEGMEIPGGGDVDFLSVPAEKGMRVVNRSASALRFQLKFDGVDAASGAQHDAVFEGIEIPAGAALNMNLPDVADTGMVHLGWDLNRDGVVDRSSRSPAEYVLVIRATATGAVAEWRVRFGEAALEVRPSLGSGSWTPVAGTPVRSGSLRSLPISTDAASGFFRLVRP